METILTCGDDHILSELVCKKEKSTASVMGSVRRNTITPCGSNIDISNLNVVNGL